MMAGPDRHRTDSTLSFQLVLLLVLASACLIGALLWGWQHARSVAQAAALVQQRRQENDRLGLPEDYPIDLAPIYQGAHITKSSHTATKSTAGDPMDGWQVHAETSANKDDVFKFYNDLLLKKNMSQTMYASVPSGTAATFADERTEVQVTAEKKRTDKLTQLDIRVSRLVNPPTQKKTGK